MTPEGIDHAGRQWHHPTGPIGLRWKDYETPVGALRRAFDGNARVTPLKLALRRGDEF